MVLQPDSLPIGFCYAAHLVSHNAACGGIPAHLVYPREALVAFSFVWNLNSRKNDPRIARFCRPAMASWGDFDWVIFTGGFAPGDFNREGL